MYIYIFFCCCVITQKILKIIIKKQLKCYGDAEWILRMNLCLFEICYFFHFFVWNIFVLFFSHSLEIFRIVTISLIWMLFIAWSWMQHPILVNFWFVSRCSINESIVCIKDTFDRILYSFTHLYKLISIFSLALIQYDFHSPVAIMHLFICKFVTITLAIVNEKQQQQQQKKITTKKRLNKNEKRELKKFSNSIGYWKQIKSQLRCHWL